MNEVATNLYVGTVEDAGEAQLLDEHSVSLVVSLTFSSPEQGFPSSVDVVEHPMMDGPRCDRDSFESAVSRTLNSLKSGEAVLVHCSRGASRSPSVAAVSLALRSGVDINEAFQQVQDGREEVDPHEDVVRLAVEVYRDLRN